jgi:hypothetical protein
MKVLPEGKAKDWGVVQMTDGGRPPFLKGDVGDDYACGGCGLVLVESWPNDRRIENMALRCPSCGAINGLKIR